MIEQFSEMHKDVVYDVAKYIYIYFLIFNIFFSEVIRNILKGRREGKIEFFDKLCTNFKTLMKLMDGVVLLCCEGWKPNKELIILTNFTKHQ